MNSEPVPASDASSPTWSVLRQDDAGNRFLIQTGLTLSDAEQLVREFEARGHKQLYWIELNTKGIQT